MQRPNRHFPQTTPPPQRRHRAVAELDNHIAAAEADLARWREAASVGTVKRLYDRMAPLYDVLNSVYEYGWKRRLRAVMFREASGRLLDVGVGTGCNMPFYPKGQTAVGIDLSPGMLAQARERARALGIDVELRAMDLLRLDFPDDSFDPSPSPSSFSACRTSFSSRPCASWRGWCGPTAGC